MTRPEVCRHLSTYEYRVLLQVYADHNISMRLEERKKYTFSDIVKVERDVSSDALKVYYRNGDWWYYTFDGHWY